MGVDLSGKRGSFSMNWSGWEKVYKLAIENGWKPVGTEPADENTMKRFYGDDARSHPMEDDWSGTYFSNDFQLVTAEDAANMANALDRSREFQLTDDDEWLKECIVFAKGGDFQIW